MWYKYLCPTDAYVDIIPLLPNLLLLLTNCPKVYCVKYFKLSFQSYSLTEDLLFIHKCISGI